MIDACLFTMYFLNFQMQKRKFFFGMLDHSQCMLIYSVFFFFFFQCRYGKLIYKMLDHLWCVLDKHCAVMYSVLLSRLAVHGYFHSAICTWVCAVIHCRLGYPHRYPRWAICVVTHGRLDYLHCYLCWVVRAIVHDRKSYTRYYLRCYHHRGQLSPFLSALGYSHWAKHCAIHACTFVVPPVDWILDAVHYQRYLLVQQA